MKLNFAVIATVLFSSSAAAASVNGRNQALPKNVPKSKTHAVGRSSTDGINRELNHGTNTILVHKRANRPGSSQRDQEVIDELTYVQGLLGDYIVRQGSLEYEIFESHIDEYEQVLQTLAGSVDEVVREGFDLSKNLEHVHRLYYTMRGATEYILKYDGCDYPGFDLVKRAWLLNVNVVESFGREYSKENLTAAIESLVAEYSDIEQKYYKDPEVQREMPEVFSPVLVAQLEASNLGIDKLRQTLEGHGGGCFPQVQ